jgi:hypothetical protein
LGSMQQQCHSEASKERKLRAVEQQCRCKDYACLLLQGIVTCAVTYHAKGRSSDDAMQWLTCCARSCCCQWQGARRPQG